MKLGDAIAAAISGVTTQRAVAQAIGVNDSTVTRWIQGVIEPTLDDIAAVERLTNRPRGWILHAAGYVANVTSVLEAIEMDSRLDGPSRRALADAYRGAVKHSSRHGKGRR